MGQPLLFTYLLTQWLLQVRCREVDAVGRRCRWSGRRDQINSHQHVYNQRPGDQHQSALAGRKRSAENHDEAPSAKAARAQTSSVPAGTATVEPNGTSIVRDSAASAPDLQQSSTGDNRHHVGANDDRADEEIDQAEEEEEDGGELLADVVHVLCAAAKSAVDEAADVCAGALRAAVDLPEAAINAYVEGIWRCTSAMLDCVEYVIDSILDD